MGGGGLRVKPHRDVRLEVPLTGEATGGHEVAKEGPRAGRLEGGVQGLGPRPERVGEAGEAQEEQPAVLVPSHLVEQQNTPNTLK